jgi:hypothetical protein
MVPNLENRTTPKSISRKAGADRSAASLVSRILHNAASDTGVESRRVKWKAKSAPGLIRLSLNPALHSEHDFRSFLHAAPLGMRKKATISSK